MRQLVDLQTRIDENTLTDSGQKKAFENELQSTLRGILASDESRRAAFQLACDEEQQVVADKWMHVFRYLIDERGPWSANPFPNCVVRHWKLDKTEDAWRRRLKLRQNYHFDEKLCHPSSNASENEAAVVPCENNSGAGVPIPEQMKRLLLKGIRRITVEVNPEASESDNESNDSQGMNSEEVPDGQFSPQGVYHRPSRNATKLIFAKKYKAAFTFIFTIWERQIDTGTHISLSWYSYPQSKSSSSNHTLQRSRNSHHLVTIAKF